MPEVQEKTLVHNRSGYTRGCRCQTCVAANREYQRQYMARWRDSKKKPASG